MPLQGILVVHIFLCLRNRFYGTIPTILWELIHSPYRGLCIQVGKIFTCPRNDANTVVGFVQRNILNIYGAPRTIISDEGSHFANKLFAKLMSIYGVRQAMGLAYHPQSNR